MVYFVIFVSQLVCFIKLKWSCENCWYFEKSGRIAGFYKHLREENGFLSVPFIPLRENWFNVLFYNGKKFYCLQDHLQHIFDIVKDDNKLLNAVHSDFQLRSYLCGCRALGLINKFVAGHLWRLMESGIRIFDLNTFGLSIVASEFMLDNVIFSENIEILKDNV